MAQDFKHIAEAYRLIYEASPAEMGAIAGTAGQATQQPQASVPSAAPVASQSPQQKIQFNTSDTTKILKSISEVYRKTKEVTDILVRYNIPGAQRNLQQEATKLAILATQIVDLTPDAANKDLKNKLYSNLDKEIVGLIPNL